MKRDFCYYAAISAFFGRRENAGKREMLTASGTGHTGQDRFSN